MDDAQRVELLREIHQGRASRNRDFERFAHPEVRRVLSGYRRVRSLLRDIARPDARAGARWSDNPGRLDVAVECHRLCYRRVVILCAWEAEFFLGEAKGSLSMGSPRPHPLS